MKFMDFQEHFSGLCKFKDQKLEKSLNMAQILLFETLLVRGVTRGGWGMEHPQSPSIQQMIESQSGNCVRIWQNMNWI